MFAFVRLIMFVFDMICFVLCSLQVGRLCAGAFCGELGAGGRAVAVECKWSGVRLRVAIAETTLSVLS